MRLDEFLDGLCPLDRVGGLLYFFQQCAILAVHAVACDVGCFEGTRQFHFLSFIGKDGYDIARFGCEQAEQGDGVGGESIVESPFFGENRVEFGCRVIVDHEDGLIVKSSHSAWSVNLVSSLQERRASKLSAISDGCNFMSGRIYIDLLANVHKFLK